MTNGQAMGRTQFKQQILGSKLVPEGNELRRKLMGEDNQWIELLGQFKNLKSKYTENNGVKRPESCSR